MNFDLGFRVQWPWKRKIFEILFPLSSLMTSSWEPKNLIIGEHKKSQWTINKEVRIKP